MSTAASDWRDYAADQQTVTGANGTYKTSNQYSNVWSSPYGPAVFRCGNGSTLGDRPMYMALFALIGAFSIWAVLRNSPAFSTRHVLEFFAVLAAMVGAFVLAILATLKYTERLPQAVQLGAIFGVVGLGTLAMIAVAIQASLPRGAPLPASAKRLNVFQKRTYVWARRLGYALLAFALLMLVLRGTPQAVLGTLGGLFGFVGIVMVFGLWLTARRTDRWLSAVEADPWVHWTYTPEQWLKWTEVAVQREAPESDGAFHWRRDGKIMASISIVVLGALLFLVDAPLKMRIIIAGIFAVTMTAGLALAGRRKAKASRLRRKSTTADLEVYFGQDGLFALGEFTPWLTVGVYLQAASLDQREPRSLALRFQQVVAGYGSANLVPKTLNLPLPEIQGVENDLARLQKELSARCQKAAITLA
jgi:hypothetical protein